MVTVLGDIEVCEDCMMVHANGETGNETPDREPWSKMPGADVAMNFDTETRDGYAEFSGRDCDGCGTTDAGKRFRFAVFAWEREPMRGHWSACMPDCNDSKCQTIY